MEIGKYIENMNKIEEHVNLSINLLKVAKTYCEYNFDKAGEVSTLNSIIDIVLNEQKTLANDIDSICLSN